MYIIHALYRCSEKIDTHVYIMQSWRAYSEFHVHISISTIAISGDHVKSADSYTYILRVQKLAFKLITRQLSARRNSRVHYRRRTLKWPRHKVSLQRRGVHKTDDFFRLLICFFHAFDCSVKRAMAVSLAVIVAIIDSIRTLITIIMTLLNSPYRRIHNTREHRGWHTLVSAFR